MRHSFQNALAVGEFDKTLGCTHLRQNPVHAPARGIRIASVPIMGMRMRMIMTNPHVDHLILLQLPLRITRGKRELRRTMIAQGRLNKSCPQGLPPLTLLKSLPRQLKPVDPSSMLKSPNSQGMCMVISIPHKLRKKSGRRGTGVKESVKSRGPEEIRNLNLFLDPAHHL